MTAADREVWIGVDVQAESRSVAAEFFELFKIPWAFSDERRVEPFAAVITSSASAIAPESTLVVCIGPHEGAIDRALGLTLAPVAQGSLLAYRGQSIPIRTSAVAFSGGHESMDLVDEPGSPVAVIVRQSDRTVIRIGYDLFAEVARLLSEGQPPNEAMNPAIEIQISLVRDALLAIGFPVVEIPPRPLGHPFVVCLTHDIDFMGVRHHGLDHTLAGFAYRAVRSLLTPGHWRKAWRNLVALLSLPGVYLKLLPDFWYPLDRYAAADRELPATFFFLPFAGRPGRHNTEKRGFLRAVPYDVTEYTSNVRQLEDRRAEVGVHGIDAWCDTDLGREEKAVIGGITGRSELGIRMHWLYFSEDSPRLLEAAGYTYDSTLGFNETVGFRNGTTQVFRPKGASTLLELPLQIQDTALLFPGRMHLSEATALSRCEDLIHLMNRFGGVLTINWHDRSLAPERNWDAMYARLLERLRAERPWFAQAREAVEWFRRRRSMRFSRVVWTGDRIEVDIEMQNDGRAASGEMPPAFIRVSRPSPSRLAPGRPADNLPTVFEARVSTHGTHVIRVDR